MIIDQGEIIAAQGPLVSAEQQFRGTAVLPDPSPSRFDVAGDKVTGAAFRRENFLVSLFAARHEAFEPEVGYNPYDPEQADLEGYPLDLFGDSSSVNETEFLKEQYVREMADLEALYQGGWRSLVVQVMAGILSPENLIPIGGVFGFGKAVKGAVSASLILRGAGLGLTAGAISEGVLRPTQLTRSNMETVANITASALFGGFIGSAGVVLGKGREAIAREIVKLDADLFAKGKSGDLSAAINRHMDPEDYIAKPGEDPAVKMEQALTRAYLKAASELAPEASDIVKIRAPENIFGRIAKQLIRFTPGNYVAAHSIAEFRILGNRYSESRLLTKELTSGDPIVQSFEAQSNRLARLASGKLGEMAAVLREARNAKSFKVKISDQEWKDMVGKALKRDQKADTLTSDPGVRSSVEKAANLWRAFQDPLTQSALDLHMLRSKDLKGTAPSHFMRRPDPILVKRDIVDVDGQPLSLNEVLRAYLAGKGDPFAKANARRTVTYMSGGTFDPSAGFDDIPGFAGPLRERGLLLPDIELEPWMVNDPFLVLPLFMTRFGPQLTFARAVVAESPLFAKLNSELQAAVRAAEEGNDYTKLVGLDEDAQHLRSAGVLDATRDPENFKRARIIDDDILELQRLRPKSLLASRLHDSLREKKATATAEFSEQIKTARERAKEAAPGDTAKKIATLEAELKKLEAKEAKADQRAELTDKGRDELLAKISKAESEVDQLRKQRTEQIRLRDKSIERAVAKRDAGEQFDARALRANEAEVKKLRRNFEKRISNRQKTIGEAKAQLEGRIKPKETKAGVARTAEKARIRKQIAAEKSKKLTASEFTLFQKEGPEAVFAKRKRAVELLVAQRKTSLEEISANVAKAKESRADVNRALKLTRADLKRHRAKAVDIVKEVEKARKPGAKHSLGPKVEPKKLPQTDKEKRQLIGRVSNTVFKTGNLEAKRNIDSTYLLHGTEGPLGRALTRRIEAEPNPRKKKALEEQGIKGFANLRGMRDRIQHRHTNIYKDPIKWAMTFETMKGLRNYLFSTDLMNVVLTSLPDTASGAMVAGAENYAAAFIHRMKKPLDSFLLRADEETIIMAMASHEVFMQGSRAAMIVEGFEMGMSATTLGRGMEFLSRKTARWSGLNAWNAHGKATTGVGVLTRIINESRAVVRGTATKTQKANLATVGIDGDMIPRIVAQWDRWKGHADTGARLQVRQPMMDDWQDPGAREVLETAIVSETNRGILTPSVGNIPLFMDQEWAKLTFMYKNFLFDATQKLMFLGIQRSLYLRDMNVLMNFLIASATGMGIYYMRTKLAGREVSDDPRQWVFEGIDRSGWGGMPLDFANMMNSAFGGSISEALGGQVASRYVSRGGFKAFTGALGGGVDDLLGVGRDVISGDVTGTTLERGIRSTPVLNFIPIRKLFIDHLKDAFIDFTDLPENGTERRARERREQGIFGVQE